MDNLGYCCINQTLRKDKVYTSRTLIRRTFSLEKASELALQNCLDLITILKWNIANDIKVFRVSSDIFPRITDKVNGYDFRELLTHKECEQALAKSGEIAYDHNMILSCHPGPYTVLGSEKENVISNSLKEILSHALMIKLVKANVPDLPFHMNFHVGNRFSEESADRFCSNFEKLPEEVKQMIIVENDDKASCWSINKLYNYIHKRIGVPLTFDYHHSKFSREPEIDVYEEFQLAKKTWKHKNSPQEIHYSSSENNTPKHSDYILEQIPDWLINDQSLYIHLEAKAKELALIEYRNQPFYTNQKNLARHSFI